MFTRRVLINGKRSNLYLHNHSTVLTFSASSKSPSQLPGNLWNNVVVLKCDSSSKSGSCVVYLVGTCHISADSCKEVQAVIKHIKPQVVFLELCSGRFKSFLDYTTQARKVPTLQQIMDVTWKKKKVNASGTALSYFNTMITSRRISNISLWHWMECAYHLLFHSDFKPDSKVVEKKMEELKNAVSLRQLVDIMDDPDMLKFISQELSNKLPALAEIVINERDMYMSASLLEVSKRHSSVVAVVGKAHLEGIVKYWKQPIDTKRLMEIPTKRPGIFRNHASIATGLALATGLYFICMRLL